MIKLYSIFLIISVIAKGARYEKKITLPIDDRIKLLKSQIKEQVDAIKQKRSPVPLFDHESELKPFAMRASDTKRNLELENYDYVELDDKAITPIMDFDPRKKDSIGFRLPRLKTTTAATTPKIHYTPYYYKPRVIKASFQKHPPLRNLNLNAGKNKYTRPQEQPVDIFYRRQIDPSFYRTPVKWLHCNDLITPLLTGLKTECDAPKFYNLNNRFVSRLTQLLTVNTTTYKKDEMYELLKQISNVQIRLFQWNSPPLRQLLTILTDSDQHSFKTLKHGIKTLFYSWRLDFSNLTNLLTQSRIFRPYCLNVGHHGGSTKSSRQTIYSKSTISTSKCTETDDSAQTTLAGET